MLSGASTSHIRASRCAVKRAFAQRRATLFCTPNMLLEHVFKSRPGHRAATRIEEKFGYDSLATDRQPRPKIGAGPLPDRQYSFAPPFPENSNRRLRLKGYVFDFQADQFGDPESCHKTYIQHGAITDSKPGMGAGTFSMACISSSVRYATSFVSVLLNGIAKICRTGQRGWHLILDIAHERFDGGQSSISRNRPVLALSLDVLQESEYHLGIDLFGEVGMASWRG